MKPNRAPAPAMPGAPGQSERRRRLALRLTAALLLLALMLVGLAWLLLQVPYASLAGLERLLFRLKYAGVSLQVIAAAAAGWRWSALVDWAVRRGHLAERLRAPALAARRNAVLLMLALIVAVSIGPGDLMRLYQSLSH